jgi:hypothetical protein
LIDKDSLFHPFRARPTGRPGIEGVRSELAEKRPVAILFGESHERGFALYLQIAEKFNAKSFRNEAIAGKKAPEE